MSQERISIYQIAYKNLLRKKTRSAPDHPGHRPLGLGPDQPARLQPRLRVGPEQGHRQHGLPGPGHGQGLPLRGGDADAQGRHGPALHEGVDPRRHPQAPGGREDHAPCSWPPIFDPNKGESGGHHRLPRRRPGHLPGHEDLPQVQAGRLVHRPRRARGRRRLRGGRARAARGRRQDAHPREERRAHGRRRPGPLRHGQDDGTIFVPSGPSRRSSTRKARSPPSGSRWTRTPTSPSSRTSSTTCPTSRSCPWPRSRRRS